MKPILCPVCRISLDLPDHLAGSPVRCSHCRTLFTPDVPVAEPVAGGPLDFRDATPAPPTAPPGRVLWAVGCLLSALLVTAIGTYESLNLWGWTSLYHRLQVAGTVALLLFWAYGMLCLTTRSFPGTVVLVGISVLLVAAGYLLYWTPQTILDYRTPPGLHAFLPHRWGGWNEISPEYWRAIAAQKRYQERAYTMLFIYPIVGWTCLLAGVVWLLTLNSKGVRNDYESRRKMRRALGRGDRIRASYRGPT